MRVELSALSIACGLVLGATPCMALETVLVADASPMVYRANTSDPGVGTTWTAEAFAPTGWIDGTYGVGYETDTGAEALLETTTASGASSVYTRATFEIANLAAVASVHLAADWDDGYVAWINGVEVYRSAQMPGGAPAWDTPASSHESSNNAAPSFGTVNDISAAALGAMHAGTNVLAIGAWNASSGSSDLVLVPRLSVNRDNAVTRGPYLQLGTSTGMVVRWRSLAATDSCVRFGTTAGNLTDSACDASSVTDHMVQVTDLAPDTRYYYSVGSSTEAMGGGTVEHFFVTAPVAGAAHATRVWVLGDSGTANADAAAVRDAYLAAVGAGRADLMLMLGDNAYNSGTDNEYQQAVFETYAKQLANTVLWPTLGNHDGVSADSGTQSGPYYDIFTLPAAAQAGGLASGTEAYWSFDYGDVHFICLDSYDTPRGADQAMMTWLAADLADTTANWVVAFFHHPPYSKGSHDSDTEGALIDMRTIALPILEAGGVDLVLAGHSHSYERSFLLDGHYGASGTLTPAMKLDPGSGRDGDTGAYLKSGGGPVPHDGAVYVTAGSSGQADTGALNHPAMYVSTSTLGSVVLDVDGNRLDATFVDDTGAALDTFAIEKVSPPPLCGNGVPDGSEECDDGNTEAGDGCDASCRVSCPPAPRVDCRAAAYSRMRVSIPADPAKAQLRWIWSKGPAVAVGDLGDPTNGGFYDLCYYVDVPGAGSLAGDTRLPVGDAWSDLGTRGYSYVDAAGSVGGVQGLRLSAGDAGRSRLRLKARGAALASAPLPQSTATIQLLDRAGDGCWSSVFATGTASSTSFKATARLP